MWQDAVFSVGAVIFGLALVPSIRSPHKPAFWTSFTTALVLTAFGATYLSLGLLFSAGTTLITASLWFLLANQRGVS